MGDLVEAVAVVLELLDMAELVEVVDAEELVSL